MPPSEATDDRKLSVSDNPFFAADSPAVLKQPIFAVQGAGEGHFNGQYIVDRGVKKGPAMQPVKAYRKLGGGSPTIWRCVDEPEKWRMAEDYRGHVYYAYSAESMPPSSGWSCAGGAAEPPPSLVYVERSVSAPASAPVEPVADATAPKTAIRLRSGRFRFGSKFYHSSRSVFGSWRARGKDDPPAKEPADAAASRASEVVDTPADCIRRLQGKLALALTWCKAHAHSMEALRQSGVAESFAAELDLHPGQGHALLELLSMLSKRPDAPAPAPMFRKVSERI